jgi:hypothetical protein
MATQILNSNHFTLFRCASGALKSSANERDYAYEKGWNTRVATTDNTIFSSFIQAIHCELHSMLLSQNLRTY